MATVLRFNISGEYENGSIKQQLPIQGSYSIALTTQAQYSDIWPVSTSEESLAFPPGSLVTEGYAVLKNLDTTNAIRYGFATGVYPLRLKAGECALLRIDPAITTLYTIALVAECKLLITVYGD